MTWIKKHSILIIIVILLELLFLNSYKFDINFSQFSKYDSLFFLSYQLLIVISFLSIYLRVWLTFAITVMLLLVSNLLWSVHDDFKTLPPNFIKHVLIPEGILPGFDEDINIVSADRYGFRSLLEFDYDESQGFRIFTIGGSTTEEIYIDDNETWTAHLKHQLADNGFKDVEAVNTGVSGLRAVHHLRTQEYVTKLNPDLMIFLVGANDWNMHIIVKIHKSSEDSEDPPSIIENTIDSPSVIENIITSLPLIENTILYRSLERMSNYSVIRHSGSDRIDEISTVTGDYLTGLNDSLNREDKLSVDIDEVYSDYKLNMKEIARNCNAEEYSCIFVTQPNAYSNEISDELRKRLWMTPPNTSFTLSLEQMISIAKTYNDWLIDFGRENDIPVCDLAKEIPPSTSYFYDDVHFNELGSIKVSEEIFKCLVEAFPQFEGI